MGFPNYLGMTGTDTFYRTHSVKVKILGSTRNGSVLFFCAANEPMEKWSTMFAKFFEPDPGQTPCGDGLPIFDFSDQDPNKEARISAWEEPQH